jgi:hypothetical protein
MADPVAAAPQGPVVRGRPAREQLHASVGYTPAHTTATLVQKPYQPDEDPEGWIATFADPDDNYFQLVSPFPG